jgi:hypothetical protein
MTTQQFPRFLNGSNVLPAPRWRVATLALLMSVGLFIAVPAVGQAASATTQICLTGKLNYDHSNAEAGTSRPLITLPARNANWELWGRTDSTGSSRWLASGITGVASGEINACYDATAPLQDVFVRFYSASTSVWRVIKSTTDQTQYTFDTAHQASVSASKDLGTVKVPASMQRAWNIVDTLNLLYWNRANPSTPCWTRHQVWGSCDTLTFVWSQDATTGGYWDFGTKYVIMNANQPDSQHFILHEAGHWFQWRLYNRSFPVVTGCNPHYIEKSSSTSCAWTEGFADAVAAYVLGDYRFVFDNGTSFSIVNGPTTPGWDKGDTVQGRVGGSLLDFWAANGPDGGNWDRTIDLMSREFSQDFKEHFTVDRPIAVPPLTTTGAAKTIIQNHTIVY